MSTPPLALLVASFDAAVARRQWARAARLLAAIGRQP